LPEIAFTPPPMSAPCAFDAPEAALCVQCGKALPADFTGPSCPACLLLGAGSGASGTSGEIYGEITVAIEGPGSGPSRGGEAPGQIGPYRLFERLGEGGFGTVWRAGQSEPIRREVALKLIKPGMDSREVVTRFEAERQALALMEHPNIAGVIDAGTTAEGRPYFVMELVRGLPITHYCDERRLTVRERLELFIPVCQAVQHAHQKAILHRDLKPSNLLVTEVDGRPVPKVIDFGIAKALGNSAEDVLRGSLARTVAGMVIGTPQYMSPEQAGATPDLDTRSDVYTLGVILHELLTGRTPLGREELGKAAFDEMLRLIREEETKKPSTRIGILEGEKQALVSKARGADPGKLRRQLSGDLDWIVLRALEKERERRYGSAADLAADIQRHLESEPVEAGPPSAAYRFGKFVRRNRLAFASAAGIAVLLVAGVAVSTWQAVRATRAERRAEANAREAQANYARAEEQRHRADEEAELAREVNEFLRNDLLRQAGSRAQADEGNEADPNLTVRQVLERAADRIGGRFEGRPLVEAEIRQTIGVACREVGDHDRAIEQLEAASALRKLGLGVDHPDTLRSMNSLAVAYASAGRLNEAIALHEETLNLRKARFGPGHSDTLTSMSNLARAYRSVGRLGDSLPLYEETLQLSKSNLGPEHPDTLRSMNSLAVAYSSAGRLDEALALHEETLRVRKSRFGPEHPDTLGSMNNLAQTYRFIGRLDEALSLHKEAAELFKARLGPEHPDSIRSMENLAGAYYSVGRLDEALVLNETTLKLRKGRLGPEHPDTLGSLNNLARILQSAGRHDEAEALFREGLELCRQKNATRPGSDPGSEGVFLHHLADLLRQKNELAEARQLAEEAVTLYQLHPGLSVDESRHAWNVLASLQEAQGDPEGAKNSRREALRIQKPVAQ
jgi:serine/threonine protein kinase/tetratricopeptide (TPR) repeat protein